MYGYVHMRTEPEGPEVEDIPRAGVTEDVGPLKEQCASEPPLHLSTLTPFLIVDHFSKLV